MNTMRLVKYSNETPILQTVFESLAEYEAFIDAGKWFFHQPSTVQRYLREGKIVTVNGAGGWCTVTKSGEVYIV